MNTYFENVYRYRILRHEDLPERHKAAYRLNGINPENLWNLIWSFKDEADALRVLAEYNTDPEKPKFFTYKMVDAGQDETIERQAWF